MVLSPWKINPDRTIDQSKNLLISQGYTKIFANKKTYDLADFDSQNFKADETYIIIDRLKHTDQDEDYSSRLGDSIQTGFYEGFGEVFMYQLATEKFNLFSNKFEEDGEEFIEPSINFSLLIILLEPVKLVKVLGPLLVLMKIW